MKDPNAAKLEKHRGVYWLPCSATEHTDGVPLCPNPRAARLAVEAPPISVPDPDATPMQLEESEETRRPKHRALPANVSKEEFNPHQLTHLPFRSFCDHYVRGKAVDDAHRPRIDTDRGGSQDGYGLLLLGEGNGPSACEGSIELSGLKFTGRTRLIIMSDQENAVKNLVDMVRDSRTHETAVINTPKGSSASAGGIERANFEVEKLIRTLRSRFEENYGESVGLGHKMLPFLVRHCAWLITLYQVESDGKTPFERLRGRTYQGQVAEFAEVVHFRDPGKAADMPKLDDRWNLGLWLGKSLASDEHYVGTSAGVRRCRSIWRHPEKQRWDKKMMTEMNGEPWNPVPPKDKAPQVRGVCITLKRQIKHGGTKGCAACFGDAKVRSPECRARFQDIVDNEAAQTAAASANEPNVETPGQAAGGSAPSSTSGPAPAAGRPASEDANMEAAESSAAQQTSPVVRTLEAEDDTSAKRQKLMAGMPILHETDVDVNMDAHKLVVLAAMPDDQGKWTQRVIDWDKKYYGAKSGTLLDTQKVYEGRL